MAQTDPAWEYWDTNTYVAIAIAVTLTATVAAWLVLRYWQNAKAHDQRRTN
jgi:FlaG/FlaF family flagellin (archaellin)